MQAANTRLPCNTSRSAGHDEAQLTSYESGALLGGEEQTAVHGTLPIPGRVRGTPFVVGG